MTDPLILRPGITNPKYWYPDRENNEWKQNRKLVLERDQYTCSYCNHHALKYMAVHHIADSNNNSLDNLTTICVACHAVLHIGKNMQLGVLEIWAAQLSQVEIVRYTREGIRSGKTLDLIKTELQLVRGDFLPDSSQYAGYLLENIGDNYRAYLPEPLCAVFVKLKRWQIE